MDRISELSDELLVKILSFLPTKVAVSTCILSKHWEFLWMWLPKLEYNDSDIKGPASSAIRYRDFIDKNLPLHRGPVIESLLLSFYRDELLQPESIKRWVEIAVSRCVRELSISFSWYNDDPPDLSLPSSLYTCNSLTTLKLEGKKIFVDVPRTVCLPSLKTLLLRCVTYLNEDSLQLLLSYCPVLEDLLIERAEQNDESPYVSLPSSLYTCNSLTTLKLEGKKILVDVPRTACLPSLKTLQLRCVTYLNEDSLRLLLSYCPVLEDLLIERDGHDNVRALVVTFPSLQRLSLTIGNECSSGGYVIVTPSLKYFKFEDSRDTFSCLIEHMPKLEEADIDVVQDCEKLLESITSVRRLSLRAFVSLALDSLSRVGTVFNQLEHFKLCICTEYWPKFLVRLLRKSPKLQFLNLCVDNNATFDEYHPVKWKNMWKNERRSSVPECLSTSLETFEFAGYCGTQEERDFLSFFFEHASCLKSISITDHDPR